MVTRWVAASLIALAAIGLTAPAAQASATGTLTFECEARLPSWPTPSATGGCDSALLARSAEANVSGIDNTGTPYAVAGLGQFNSQFSYSTVCILNEPPLLFNATGQAVVSGVAAVRGATTTTANLTFFFNMTGIGPLLVIVTDGLDIEFASEATASSVAPGTGSGTVVFIPPVHPCPQGPAATGIAGATITWSG